MNQNSSKAKLFYNKIDEPNFQKLNLKVRLAVNNGSHYGLNYPLRFLP